MNACRNCIFWQKCMEYRYSNNQKEYMTKVTRKLNSEGNTVIFVQECTKYVRFKPFKGSISR